MVLKKMNSMMRFMYLASRTFTRMAYRTGYMAIVLLLVFLMFGVSPETTLFQFVQVTHHQGFWIIAVGMALIYEVTDFAVRHVSNHGLKFAALGRVSSVSQRSVHSVNTSIKGD